MANIKISELNEILKKDNADVLAIVDTSADETKKITVEDLLDKNVELIAVTDTEPAECSYGDKYFNTTDNLIYTAIATDTWSEDGEEPISGILYIVYADQASYSWNGTELISVGGGKEDIVIDDEEPTDPDVKLWIDTGEVGSQVSEITNEYSESTGLGYSANYVNGLVDLLTTNKTTTPISSNRDCLLVNDDTVKGININFNPTNAPSQNTMVMWKVFLTDNTTSDGYWTYIVLAITLDDHKMFMNAYHNAVNTWIGWQQF